MLFRGLWKSIDGGPANRSNLPMVLPLRPALITATVGLAVLSSPLRRTPAGQQRIAATSPTDSASPKSVTATCPSGQRVIGTGHELANGRGQVLLDDVIPSADLTSVRVEAFEDQDGTTNPWSVTAYAICADA
jgi:hypothetical protein